MTLSKNALIKKKEIKKLEQCKKTKGKPCSYTIVSVSTLATRCNEKKAKATIKMFNIKGSAVLNQIIVYEQKELATHIITSKTYLKQDFI